MAEAGLLTNSFQVSPIPQQFLAVSCLLTAPKNALKLVGISSLCQAGAALERTTKACLPGKNVYSEVERQHHSAAAKYT